MKKFMIISLYLFSAWFVGTGILQVIGKLEISNNLAGFTSICFGLSAAIWALGEQAHSKKK